MATTNNSGVGRKSPHSNTVNNPGNQSIDDDQRQVPVMVVGFTVQSMIVSNTTTTSPYQMIV